MSFCADFKDSWSPKLALNSDRAADVIVCALPYVYSLQNAQRPAQVQRRHHRVITGVIEIIVGSDT